LLLIRYPGDKPCPLSQAKSLKLLITPALSATTPFAYQHPNLLACAQKQVSLISQLSTWNTSPIKKCVELKSYKLYIWSYRDEGAFHEDVTNQILSDLVAATDPRFMRITAEFNVRGGVYTTVVAEHRAEGWVAPEPVHLA